MTANPDDKPPSGRAQRGAAAVEGAEGGVAAVDRALSLLRAFEDGASHLTLGELSARTGLYKSTILRLAKSLEHGGMLTRLPDGAFRLGSETLRLGSVFQHGTIPREAVLTDMRQLSSRFDESVALYVPDGPRHRVCLYRINAMRVVNYNVRPGDTVELPYGSAGKVMAAFLAPDGPQGAAIRARMYDFSVGDRDPELASISVPLFGGGRALAGTLTIGGPKGRIDEAFAAAAIPAMLDVAIKVSVSLGGSADGLRRARAALTPDA